jgi:hypothetical protein
MRLSAAGAGGGYGAAEGAPRTDSEKKVATATNCICISPSGGDTEGPPTLHEDTGMRLSAAGAGGGYGAAAGVHAADAAGRAA